jgi:deazaflavin-dependent oxidoreductase (nitroreductase family)
MWINPIMIWLIRSPFHKLVSNSMMVVTYTGRKSGKLFDVPVDYSRQDNVLFTISLRHRKWWRNLRGGAQVHLRLQGKDVQALATVSADDQSVAAYLMDLVRRNPVYARFLQIGCNMDGNPVPTDALRAAEKRVVIRYDLGR